MFVLPLAIELREKKMPSLTLWISFVCLMMFIQQQRSETRYYEALGQYCKNIADTTLFDLLKHAKPDLQKNTCYTVYVSVRKAADQDAELLKLSREAKPLNFLLDRDLEIDYLYRKLKQGYARFEKDVPINIKDEWVYLPTDITLSRMVTASLAHSSWRHLLGNLLFFVIFGGAVELLMGRTFFAAFAFCTCITTHVAYSYSVVSGFASNLPSLGLSGVIMGMVALTGMLLPKAKVTFFIWLVFFFSFFRIPALLVAAWYVYWDLYGMSHYMQTSCVGYVAHVSGAMTGITCAWLLLKFLPRTIRRLQQEVSP